MTASQYDDGTYLENNTSWHVEDSAWKANQISRILIANRIVNANICEVGCGAGEILHQLSKTFTSSKFVGYEISPQAFELCQERASERVTFELKNILSEDVSFDCLLCIDVFEHVDDYMGFIKALKPKAEFKIFHIPLEIHVMGVLRDHLTHGRDISGHLHYFTRETAIATLEDCGLEVVDSFYTPAFLDFPAGSLKRRLINWPIAALYKFSPDLAVRVFGGCSLLVLTK